MTECPENVDDCPAARAAAKEAVQAVFAILGVDINSPKDIEEFRKSLRWGDSMRRAADKGFTAFILAVVALLFSALITGVKIKFGG